MTVWSAGMSGAGPFDIVMEAINSVSGTTCAVTVRVKWNRDAYGFSAFDHSADWSITIDGTRYTGTDDFSAPAGGAIGDQTVASRTKNITLVRGAAAQTITVAVTYGTATSSAGSGSLSRSYTLPRLPYAAPARMANPTLSSNAPGQVVVNWVKPSGTVSNYTINYWVNGVFNSVTGLTGLSRTFTVTPGANFSCDIRAYNQDALGDWSDVVAITADAAAPTAPTALSCTPFLGPQSASVGFTPTWTAPSSTGGKPVTYDVQYRIGAGAWTLVPSTASGATILTALAGQLYEVQVRAKNVDATGPWSSSASVTTPGQQPQQQSAPTLTPGTGSVQVSFTDPANTGGKPITQRDIQYRVSNGSWVLLSNVTSPYTVSGLAQGAPFEAQTRTRNADSISGWSPSATATVGGTGGGKVWNGTTYVTPTRQVWNGTAWVTPVKRVWNGTSWVSQV